MLFDEATNMEEVNTSHHHPFHPTRGNANRSTRDDWEDWEDDEPVTPIDEDDNPLIEITSASPSRPKPTAKSRVSNARQSLQRIPRLKSRARQKATIAKVGISLDTDIAKFRQRQQQHIASQLKVSPAMEPTKGKFVDAAALKALEGEPSTATVGSFHWLRKKSSKASKGKAPATDLTPTPVEQDIASPNAFTPNDRIMIGISLPPGAENEISPQTAVVGTPLEFPIILAPSIDNRGQPSQPILQQQSVWSPDTEYTNSAFPSSAGASSMHSQSFAAGRNEYIPPVPALPPGVGGRRRTTIIEDDVDLSSPMTEFEEDGSPLVTRKSLKAKTPVSPSALATRSQGWWDQITSPFMPSPSAAASPDEYESDRRLTDQWWKGTSEKSNFTSRRQTELSIVPPKDIEKQGLSRVVEEDISPTIASSSTVQPRRNEQPTQAEEHRRQMPVSAVPSEAPPPYSPPTKQQKIRYRAVFPPGHQLNDVYPPSPGPISPTMPGTMTSQGAISMTDVPLTPGPRSFTPTHLPPRPLNTFISGEDFLEATGRGHRQRTERQRRRHEKEEAIARKIGGLWKGRGCMPTNGCYGRAGREGRKKRRICCGVAAGVVALLILVIVLAVTLTRNHGPPPTPYTQWLNLTDFPPIPTGVSTVVGEDNSVTVSACTNPSTLWSCTLPKEQAPEAVPFQANQPKFIFNIQYDNSTDQAWNITGQQPPISRRALRSAPSGFRSARRDLTSPFTPNPPPPSFQEMWFLGNTTDEIQSALKAGEPTPFYMTFLHSLNSTVSPTALSRRDLINTTNFPVPDRNPNGTGAPARMLPAPYQQPLRLYDRGLATEHYGFYTYFNKTIYVKSLATLNATTAAQGEVPADRDGGSLETEANYLVIWAQTRMKVEIWTRFSGNTTRFVGGNALGTYGVGNDTRPGSFPYPVTVTVDTHGGDRVKKGTWAYKVTDRQQIDTGDFKLVANNVGFNGAVVNPAFGGDASLGGFDGGKSGCECGWTNFVRTNPGGG
ncbi:hypothetical protein CONLIGDRAFT_22530 [Coniochaeta ligniaria NRRL 30616]|uniref:Glycoprotease family protein n=1 Tax=Coniochaeta ligniaria NRRL 30616 TaxID=1408157 RepID=A0A1J7J4T0_9PEZI|nr:hypothetical protein CONLIGDRAFT_22530 [Coniochaeta ligniaria NRRL 30616]